MRPVERGDDPSGGTWTTWKDAGAVALAQRIGQYCSYCERYLPYSAAVEHVRPKKPNPALAGSWDNWLLACPNCNSIKGGKDLDVDEYLWPDRDNTARAFSYGEGGAVQVTDDDAVAAVAVLAESLYELVGLDRKPGHAHFSQLDRRWMDRRDAFDLAMMFLEDLYIATNSRQCAVLAARKQGFFSTWMAVFAGDEDMRLRLIEEFAPAPTCYDADGRTVARPGGRC